MLSHQKYICRTVLKLQLHRLLVLAILSCGPALFCWTQESAAQDDIKFREFDSNMVHSPRELARDLNYLFFKDKRNPLADIDREKLKKLKELGDDFFENLSDEEKKQAQEFADQFMRDKGLNSPEGKLLMDQLGVSPEMQSELAKEFGDNDLADFERFRDLFKNSDRPSGIGKYGSHKSEDSQRGKLSEIPKSETGKVRSEHVRGQGGQPKTDSSIASKDGPKDLFETLPNESGNKSSARRKGLPDDLAKPKSAGDLGKQFSDRANADAAKTDADRNAPRSPGEDTNSDGRLQRDSNNGEPSSRDGNGGIGDSVKGKNANDRIVDGKDAASRNLKGGQGSLKTQSKDGTKQGIAGKVDEESLADQDREFGKELLELLKDREFDPSSREGKTREPKAGKSATGSAKATPKDSRTGGAGSADGQSSPELDETFKSWIQVEAIKKGIREFRDRGGPADFQRRSLESALKKGVKGIGQSIRKGGGKSKSDFAEKLDRVLFEAAQDSVQGGADPDVESGGVGSSVEKAIDGLLGRVSEAAKKRREEKRKRQGERMVKSQTNELSQVPLSSDPPFQSENSSGSNAVEYGAEALGAAAEMLEGIAELPAFEPRKLLAYLAIAAVSILLLYLLLRRFSDGKSSLAARKFGRSFRGAKIHSPKDLVEAVDNFIVQKFGGRSQWWNAKRAQDMLCAGAPGYSAKISELLKDYVRARYTRADVTLSPEEQLNYKKTLQELAKEVPSETPADASQNEG